jgi:type II secretory pathway pseudopilin PulG
MKRYKSHTAHAFTILELLAAIVVMSVISVTLMPVMSAASESYTVSRQVRSSTERAGFAIDRILRVIREAPIGTDNSGVGITSATSSSVEFSDGSGLQLTGTTLEMLVPGSSPVPLCFDVELFEIQYFADDGVTSSSLTPSTTHRFGIKLTTDNVTMSAVAFPRVWIGQE